ncbi:hypothetical protein [Micromonospora zamorensis]|uniref:hypothetical protein n=1 Tax=Micromonospora zamorensis TaxID=709883 RepID=UPI0033A5F18E
MQPEGPYRFTHMLGGSAVGKAWAAIDDQGRFVTVAVLEAAVATVPGWREGFAGVANSLAQTPDGISYTYADFSAGAPWVAYPAEAGPGAEKLIQALGGAYTPVPTAIPPSPPQPVSGVPQAVSGPPQFVPGPSQPVSGPPQAVSGPPQSVSAPPQPVSGVPQSVSGVPVAPWAMHASPTSGQPVSASPHPISAAPASPASGTFPHGPVALTAGDAVPSHDAFSAPVRRIAPSAPRRRRRGLWIGIGALVLVLVAGVGTGAWIGLGGNDGNPATATPTPSEVVQSQTPDWLPTRAPQQPGIEPPRPGDWPKWPSFAAGDAVRVFEPEGLGFGFTAPADWTCAAGGSTEGQVKYNCGASIGANSEIGGELTVRECRDCNEERRVALRKAEEAWGLQWREGGPYVFLAETTNLNGADTFGIVVVAFWRSAPDGAIDRELVLRMSAPGTWVDVIRSVVNSVRNGARF